MNITTKAKSIVPIIALTLALITLPTQSEGSYFHEMREEIEEYKYKNELYDTNLTIIALKMAKEEIDESTERINAEIRYRSTEGKAWIVLFSAGMISWFTTLFLFATAHPFIALIITFSTSITYYTGYSKTFRFAFFILGNILLIKLKWAYLARKEEQEEKTEKDKEKQKQLNNHYNPTQK